MNSAADPVPPPLHAKVLTVSDGVIHGTREDRSGVALVEQLTAAGWVVVEHRVTADGADNVAAALREMTAGFAGLVVSTGGTGFAPRDQTPRRVARCDRAGGLSRGIAGIRGQAIICNTPGSPTGCVEQLAAVLDVLPHAVRLLAESPTNH
jgi:molybdopterin adenylyltransferase